MQTTLKQLADRIRSAADAGTALRIRGGGSKDFYGQSLAGDVIDTRVLRGVTSYEPSELVVTALAGTPLVEIEQLLSAQSQHLPFEPPHFGADATLGGMVAAGLSGPARAASGAVRDYVLGVQMLGGQGQALRFGGQVMKNVAGYDISRLMVGSMGTLGLLTEVSLKVLPCPVAEVTLCLALDQAEALRLLNRWAGMPLPIHASCWLRQDGHGVLWVRLRGADAAVRAARRQLGGSEVDPTAARDFWQSLREQQADFFRGPPGACLWRLSVPDTTAVLAMFQDEVLLEWGGALRWAWAPAAQAQVLRTMLGVVGGTATLFRRAHDGVPPEVPVFHPLAPALRQIHRALRQQFDPAGIFNPGRMFAEL